jgi:hypothetical protein
VNRLPKPRISASISLRMARGECESADKFNVGLTYNAAIKIDVAADEVGGIGG